MNTEILEGNKLIAKFMGAHQYPIGKWYKTCGRESKDGYVTTEGLKYHSSWDCLIPVVEKIGRYCDIITGNGEKNRYNVVESVKTEWTRSYPHCTHRTTILICTKLNGLGSEFHTIKSDSKNKIESIYNACIEFIKWYNLNQPTH